MTIKQKATIAGGITAVLMATVLGVGVVASQGDTVAAMEKAYSAQLEAAHSSIDALCSTEQGLAVAKLEAKDAAFLPVEQISALQLKAQGEGLTCREAVNKVEVKEVEEEVKK